MTAKLSAEELEKLERAATAALPSPPICIYPETLLCLLAQVREAEALKAWQPIETAPKDDAPVVLYMGDWLTPSFITARWNGKDWLVGQHSTVSNPTHWLPLPPPPAPEGSE